MNEGERQTERHAFGDHSQRDMSRAVQEQVATTLEGRVAGLACARHPRSLRHTVVSGVGIRPPGRGAGNAPALLARDAGYLERRGGGEAEGGLGMNASRVVEWFPRAVDDDAQCSWRPDGE
jgi:hypothetical protein